jgi:hypothetical protein
MRDYKATERAKYIEAFFRNIDWQMVERRLREEAAVRPALRSASPALRAHGETMRSTARVAWVAAVALFLAAGCVSSSGRSFGRWADDHNITTEVKMQLASLRGPSTWIRADTYDATVYLSGVVDTVETKRKAEALARGVPGVAQVVPNLMVKRAAAVAASINTERRREVWSRDTAHPHPLLVLLPGLVRIEGDSSTRPAGPFSGFNRASRRVATIYIVTMRELAQRGIDDLRAEGLPIDHVDIYPVDSMPDVPEPTYHVVLWHLTRAEARALR